MDSSLAIAIACILSRSALKNLGHKSKDIEIAKQQL